MIDYFALALTHGLLVIAFWRLLGRDDLDTESLGPGPGDEAPEETPAAPDPAARFRLPGRVPRA